MYTQLQHAIDEDLHNMEATGKVDLGIIKKLDELRVLLGKLENKWLQHENTDGFYFYQGVRNIELMLDRMQDRFENAPERNDNPKIAEDSQILFKEVFDLLHIAESNAVNQETINSILRKTRDLRNVAEKQNLIELPSVDTENVDKENAGYGLTSIMKNLDIPIDDDPLIGDTEYKNNN